MRIPPEHKRSKLTPHIVTLKVMVQYNPLDQHQIFYSVSASKPRKIGFFGKKRFFDKLTGKTFCPSLIYALTQDTVLEAISPVKGMIK